MTPTEQDIEFFSSEGAKRIQEEWEPKPGDFCRGTDSNVIKSQVGLKPASRTWLIVDYWNTDKVRVWAPSRHHPAVQKDRLTWLPRQGQLQAMLVEKGYTVCLTGPYMLPKNYQVILAREDDETEVEYGPTPSIALGKCLLEVLKEG